MPKIDLSQYDLEKLSGAQLIELSQLIEEERIAEKRNTIKHLDLDTPLNYIKLRTNFDTIKYSGDKMVAGYKGVIMEGGARSRKTYSFIDLLIYVCLYEVDNKTIIILRDTYNSFHTTLFTDLASSLDEFGLHNPFKTNSQVSQMKIRNNKIHFKGADNPNNAHGAPSFMLYFNEMLTIPKPIFDNYIMRCSHMWVGDFNPSVTEHWVFDSVIPRPDVLHVRTTYKDNPLCPAGMVHEIAGYEPFLPGSYEVINEQICYLGVPISEGNMPPPHPTNVINGTADLFLHKVYGLGLRGAMLGVIFENITYIPEWPQDMGYIYGNDFGYTNDPNALVKYAENDTDIFVELLAYQCIDNPETLSEAFKILGVERGVPIACDSSDRYTSHNKGTVEMVKALDELGWDVFKISKTKSVMHHIGTMKKKRINIVQNHLVDFARKEAENYKFREINGIAINQPIDKWNHFWDATRYAHMAWNERSYEVIW